ncbi:MAG: DUF1553 domain-containing protein [Planctomycetia bacterium]|nr:DUF1553 domain-containing protein [Planctomycetia bacterium]
MPLLAAAAAILLASPVLANPKHKQSLKRYYGSELSDGLFNCATCHDVPKDFAGGLNIEQPPHNAFGKRLAEVGDALDAAGDPSDIFLRFKKVADEDADGDGVANELEIVAGANPGVAGEKPAPAALASAQKRREAFQKRYLWDPFNPVKRPDMPAVAEPALAAFVASGNPVDAFIAREHELRGLRPRPEAPKHILLRRVYLDLVGLPPTPAELQAFLDDASPDAYEKVVERLLASPQYGERWGRHFMDIWRYSDWAGWTGGNQIRDSQPHVWRWRDWIIESLSADKTYDRMVLEMLAGDEIAPEDPETLRATGYLVRNYKMLSRETWMQDVVDHTARAFLGVTMKCAMCHDHMYDPISQEDYYRFRAIFEPHQVRTDRIPGRPDPKTDGLVRAYDADPAVATYLFERGDDRKPVKDKPIPPGVPAILKGPPYQPEAVPLPLLAYAPHKRAFVVEEDLAAAGQAIEKAREAKGAAEKAGKDTALPELDFAVAERRQASLAATVEIEKFEDAGKKEAEPQKWEELARAVLVAQRQLALAEAQRGKLAAQQALDAAKTAAQAAERKAAEKPDDAALKAAAEKAKAALADLEKKLAAAEMALEAAQKAADEPATTNYAKRQAPSYPATSSGRRTALARWIADRQNPLAARVAVNHVWLRHFGTALVPTVFDFGNNGQPPTHPALLDYLAAEFMEPSLALSPSPLAGEGRGGGPRWTKAESGNSARPWSLKHLHRLIVTSRTYRQSSTGDAANQAIDPDNVFLWRANSRRLEAELVRDGVLYVGGSLDLTRGGPDIDHAQGLSVPRRSLYFRHAAEKQMTFLKLFDAAAVTECYRRKESIVPQQALAMANSELTLHQSRKLARRLTSEAATSAGAFVAAAFLHVLSRPATDTEKAECLAFLTEQEKLLADNKTKLGGSTAELSDVAKPAEDVALRARENLVHVLLNHHDFVTVR